MCIYNVFLYFIFNLDFHSLCPLLAQCLLPTSIYLVPEVLCPMPFSNNVMRKR